MKVIYIAGPFRAPTPWMIEQNVRHAESVALAVAQFGSVPLCPHAMYRNYQGSAPDEFWLEGTMELLRRCDGLVLLPEWSTSAGSRAEKAEADRLGIPSFVYCDDMPTDLGAWLRWLEGGGTGEWVP